MPRLATFLRAAAVTALGASLLAAAPSTAQAAPVPPAAPATPAVGDCHRLTYAELDAESDSDPAVDCASTHNSLTIKVVTLPADTNWDDLKGVLNKVGTRCYRALDATLGRTAAARARSAYGIAWFNPTPQQRANGARWVRCDVILAGGLRAPLPLPHTSPLLEQPLTDRVASCLTAKPFYYVVCARKHAFRTTGVVRMGFRSYPTPRQIQRFAEAKCPSRVSSGYWRYTSPSKVAWKAGRRHLSCQTKTTA